MKRISHERQQPVRQPLAGRFYGLVVGIIASLMSFVFFPALF